MKMQRLLDLPDWFLIVLTLLGLFVWGLFKRWLESRKQQWPVVQGRIATTYVQTEMNKREERNPEVCYSYDVNGQHYFGVANVYEVNFDAYPPGSPILVHYKPSDPSVSRLDHRDMRDREDAVNVIDDTTPDS
jgi:hypothetical protein